MRPTRITQYLNWRYALGELFLIVAGILIALAITDWNDRRIERQQERALLIEVRSTLMTDIAALEHNLQRFSEAAQQIRGLLEMLQDPPAYDPAMDTVFGAVYGARNTNLNTAAYETLKSVGLQSVSDQELRLGIARVFDHHYERMLAEHEIDLQVNIEVLRPYYLAHFRDLSFWTSATPIDYDAVAGDPYFQNMVHYRLEVLSKNQLDSYALVLEDMRRVLAMLDATLPQ